jgi:DNA-binding transcriptional MerR regulator
MIEEAGVFNIETLAQKAGLTRRTVRYYVQRGLLEPPQGGGRGSYYTEEHLRRLERIRAWSEQGVPLMHIKAMLDRGAAMPELAGEPAEEGSPTAEAHSLGPATHAGVAYQRWLLADGVELHVRPGALPPRALSPERLQRVRELLLNQEAT